MRVKSFVVSCCTGVLFAANGVGATLGTYEFGSSSSEAPSVANGSFGSATWVGLNDVSSPGALSLSGFVTAGSSDLGQYVQFTFAPDPGYTLTITGFQWASSRDAQGPQSAYLRVFEGTDPANDDPALHAAIFKPSETEKLITYNLAGGGDSSDDGFTLRFYGFNAGSGSGTWSIERLSVLGSLIDNTLPVPEPTAASLALIGAVLFGARKLRARR